MTGGHSDSDAPNRKEFHRLLDILEAISNIEGHPSFQQGADAWFADKYYRGYCERQLLIIGEAASYLSSKCSYETKYPETPWRQIKALRNLLSHEYWSSDPQILWGIVDKHLPTLREQVGSIIAEKEGLLGDSSQDIPRGESKLKRRLRELTDDDSAT